MVMIGRSRRATEGSRAAECKLFWWCRERGGTSNEWENRIRIPRPNPLLSSAGPKSSGPRPMCRGGPSVVTGVATKGCAGSQVEAGVQQAVSPILSSETSVYQ